MVAVLNFDGEALQEEVEARMRDMSVEPEVEEGEEEGVEDKEVEVDGGGEDKGETTTTMQGKEVEREPVWRPHTMPANGRQAVKQIPSGQEKALAQEMDALRRLNAVLEATVRGLVRGKAGLGRFEGSMDSTSALLDVYIKILSQAEWTQRLLLDPQWKGASHDIQRLEEEARLERERIERQRESHERAKKEAALSSQSTNVPRHVASKTDHGRKSRVPSGTGAATNGASHAPVRKAAAAAAVRSSGYGNQGRTPL